MLNIRKIISQKPIFRVPPPAPVTNDAEVVIYCGGKCGSKTLQSTFRNSGFSCIHTHGINEWRLTHPELGDVIDYLRNKSKTKRVYIIDSYRTPIERKISSFFENIATHVPNYASLPLATLIHIFNEQYLNILEDYHPIDEVMNAFQVPLFTEFDFEKGYVMREEGNIVFIKLLFRDISKWSSILSTIFKQDIKLRSANLTVGKRISSLYELFKSKYRVPALYIDTIWTDEQFKIFTSAEEQIEYVANWAAKVDTNTSIRYL
jgi:hypothetical protein